MPNPKGRVAKMRRKHSGPALLIAATAAAMPILLHPRPALPDTLQWDSTTNYYLTESWTDENTNLAATPSAGDNMIVNNGGQVLFSPTPNNFLLLSSTPANGPDGTSLTRISRMALDSTYNELSFDRVNAGFS